MARYFYMEDKINDSVTEISIYEQRDRASHKLIEIMTHNPSKGSAERQVEHYIQTNLSRGENTIRKFSSFS